MTTANQNKTRKTAASTQVKPSTYKNTNQKTKQKKLTGKATSPQPSAKAARQAERHGGRGDRFTNRLTRPNGFNPSFIVHRRHLLPPLSCFEHTVRYQVPGIELRNMLPSIFTLLTTPMAVDLSDERIIHSLTPRVPSNRSSNDNACPTTTRVQ